MDSIDVFQLKDFPIYDRMNNIIGQTNPMVLTILSVIIIFYFVIFSYLGYSASNLLDMLKAGVWVVIEIIMGINNILVLINGIQYF